MDEIGRRYLLLALRLGRLVPDLIRWYTGPPGLAEAIAGEAPATAEELHLEALALRVEVGERIEGSAADDRRRRWLVDQLGALAASARLAGGQEIGFVDLVEELVGIAAEAEPAATFDSARRHLDAILPPGGPLAARLTAHDRSVALPPATALRALVRLANALRQRTVRDVWLPDGESVEFVAGTETDSATYLGLLRTRITVDTSGPVTLGRLLRLAAGAGYPGRHAEIVTKEALLNREQGLGEAMVSCRFTPAEAISEGGAELARGLILSDQELSGVLRHLVRDLGGTIPDAAVEREVLLAGARAQLRRASANAALMIWHEGMPSDEVRTWLADTAALDRRDLDAEMDRLATPRGGTRAFLSLTAPRLVAEWIEVHGQTHGLARLLAEQLSPGQMRAEIAAAAG